MNKLLEIQHRMQSMTERAIVKLESAHQKAAGVPYDLIDRLPIDTSALAASRQMQSNLISKSYRGLRDLNEMSGQAAENLLSQVGSLNPFAKAH